MKSFQHIFKRIFQRLGVYIQYYPNPQKLISHLGNKHHKIKEYEIKRVVKNVGIHNDHKFYDKFLKLNIPTWNVEYEDVQFFGKGSGEFGLNTYRKVKISGKYYYEKVYFNSYPAVKVVLWVSEFIFPLLEDNIKPSKPTFFYKGKELTVLYFPYLNLTSFPDNLIENGLVDYSRKLLKISFSKSLKEMINRAPRSSIDFRNHFLYRRNIKTGSDMLAENGINFMKIENLIEGSRLILTHGDLNEGNGFQDNFLIDWDSFGFFPIGLEVAYLYYRIHLRNNKITNSNVWLSINYKDLIPEKEWCSFNRNFSYFLFIFSCKIFSNHNLLEKQLLEVLK